MKNFTLLKKCFLSIMMLVSFINAKAQTITTTYTSSTTITVPLGVTSINVQAWGGGGRGGSRTSGSGAYGGGGGGAYASSNVSVTGGTTYTITVGSGSNSNSTDGGDSWFINTSTILAKGGQTVANNSATGGAGGTAAASIGTIRYSGGNGASGVGTTTSGGGGSSAGTGSNGDNGLLTTGGNAPAGGGDGGNGRSSSGNGSNGTTPGGGGGGALRSTGSPTGGNGANGQIILTYTIPLQPEIDVRGNAISIVDGDTTPSVTDWTDFGNSTVGSGTTRTYTIYNTGTSNLNLGAITFSGTNPTNFAITTAPSATVAPGGNTTFVVTFTPSAVGLRTATFSMVNNDSDENPYNFSIQGTGIVLPSEIDVQGNAISIVDGDTTPSATDWTDFGNSTVGSGTTRTYTIYNTGTGNLTIGAITFSGTNPTNFAVTTAPSATVIPGGNTTFVVTFTPSAVGLRTATFSMVNNDSDENPYNFSIQGTGLTPLTNGPGGVMGSLQLWLRSDLLNGTTGVADGTAVTTWNTQGRGSNATKPAAVGAPIYRNNPGYNINFNSVVDFTNNYTTAPQVYTDLDATRQYLKGATGFYTQDMYVVLIPDLTINNTIASNDIFCGDRQPSVQETDGTGFGYGAYTSRITGEVLTYAVGTSSGLGLGYSVSDRSANTYSTAAILNARNNSAINGTEFTFNDNNVVNWTTDPAAFQNVSNSQYWIGRSEGWDGSLDGRIGEIITLDSRSSDTDRYKILSYLAIKYGITLGVNGTSTNYLNSDGNVIWNATASSGYNFDIAGIGRDDISKLNQKQSKSINPTEVMTIGLTDILTTNTDNTNTFATNKSYLVWGSNGGTMVNSGAPINVDLGPTTITTITEVVNRRWKIVETGGDVATTRVSIPTAAFVSGLPPLGPTDAYVMVIADDAAFTSSLETVFMTTSGANQTLLYDFDGTRYFTFGVAHRATNPLHISLDGDDDYVRISDANELGSTFTVMTWIRPNGANTLGDERTILAKKANANSGYKIVLQNDNKIRVEWTNTIFGFPVTSSSITNTTIPNGIWHNFAVTYGANSLRLYIDGVLDKNSTILFAPAASTSTFSIGSNYVDKNNILNLFKGDIDELRMWSRVLTQTEIRFLMNQEILQTGTGTRGTIIPNTVTKNDINTLLWSNLFAYYSMNSYIGTHLDDDSGNTNRGSLIIPNKISISLQTAPMPYESNANGLWSASASWKNGAIQDLPYSLSIVDGTTPIDWNIVRTNHNINSNGNKVLLGLFTHSNTLSATNDSKIEISHHLKLDGKIDLVGKSQLVQTLNSDLDPTSSGRIERDQQGSNNIYNYNYWSSPVGAINATTNNNAYTVTGVMKDGTTTTPQNITWTAGLNGSPTSPITLSNYWIFKFQNLSVSYANWQSVGSAGSLNPGQGYTLKGSGAATDQNFTFVGKPNNGTITSTIAAGNLNLSGNPYASAIDANQFITNNSTSISGTLYFWQHSPTNNTHNLLGYQGGYASRNLVGGIAPVAPVGIAGVGTSSKVPGRFIPVGQGFFLVGSGTGGTINFNNDQRAFITETNVNSNTLFRNNATQNTIVSSHFTNNENDAIADEGNYKKLRLGFNSSDNYYKQVLLGFMEENATSGLDYGYDAVNIDTQANDMYFINNGANLNILGDGYFNVNNIYPIGIKNNIAGNVTFRIDNKENFNDDNFQAYIYDNVTNVYNNIRNVDFTINLPQGTIDNRFSLTFKNTSALSNESFTIANGIQVIFTNSNNTINIKNNVVDATVESVSLFNMLGQSIATWDVKNQNQQSIELPIKSLSTGTYIVKVKTTKGETSRKIIFN